MRAYTTEQLVDRWEHRRALKNLMGKYVVSFLLKRERTMMETFWAQREDICLGVNDGWFAGRDAVKAYFDDKNAHNERVRDLLMKLYPDQAAGKTKEELYGIGQLEERTITNCVLEIAADGETAKGLWCEFSNVTDVGVKGPLSNWVMGYFAADFILENGAWKLWHLQHLRQLDSPCAENWSAGGEKYPDLPEFAELAEEERVRPNISVKLMELYHGDRPFTKCPPIPQPYTTFAETFSYGIPQEVTV